MKFGEILEKLYMVKKSKYNNIEFRIQLILVSEYAFNDSGFE